MVGIRRRRFGSDDGVAVMVGASRQMRQYGTSQYGTVLQYGIVILQYCMVHNLLSIKKYTYNSNDEGSGSALTKAEPAARRGRQKRWSDDEGSGGATTKAAAARQSAAAR
jgi:hypothetical protein